MLRAAAKKRRGRCSALASRPPESTLPDDGMTALWRARARQRVEQDDHVTLVLDQPLAFAITMYATWMWAGRLVEGGRDDLALHRALHVGDFLRPLVDEQHDE